MTASWRAEKLGAISTISYGYTESASNDVIGPHFLRITDIQDDGVNWSTVPYCKIAVENLSKYRLAHGDIVFARTGATTGKSFLVQSPPDSVCASYLIRLRLTDSQIMPEFVSLFFQTAEYWKAIREGSSGSAQGGFNASKLADLTIQIPPTSEQQRIVAILDEAFDSIATAKANAEKNLQNARALFESHLQSVFTERGGEWTSKPLGTLCELISGQHIDAKDYNIVGRGVGYLTGPSDFGVLNPVITKWSEHPKRMAKAGDILVTVKGSGVGKINLLDANEVAISRQLMAVRTVTTDVRYLYAFLSTKFDYFQSLSNGAAIPGISREDVLGLMCPMPPPKEQQAIVELIHAVLAETQRLESIYQQKLAALDELKQSLLHQAFSGNL